MGFRQQDDSRPKPMVALLHIARRSIVSCACRSSIVPGHGILESRKTGNVVAEP